MHQEGSKSNVLYLIPPSYLIGRDKSARRTQLSEDAKYPQLLYIAESISNEVNLDIKRFQDALNLRIQELIIKYDTQFVAEVKRIKQDRVNRTLNIIVSFGLAGIATYLIYIYGSKSELASNLSNLIIGGVVVNMTSNFIGWWFSKVTDKFVFRLNKKETAILTSLRGEYNQIIEEKVDDLRNSISFDTQELLKFWRNLLISQPRDNWQEQRKGFHTNLAVCAQDYSVLYHHYREIVENSSNKAGNYFSNRDGNLQKLNEFSDQLKEEAIQPSFELLAKTKTDLKDVIKSRPVGK